MNRLMTWIETLPEPLQTFVGLHCMILAIAAVTAELTLFVLFLMWCFRFLGVAS